MNNEERANDAFDVVKKFSDKLGLDGEEMSTKISDLICSLRHLSDQYGEDFQACLESGTKNYESEIQEEIVDYGAFHQAVIVLTANGVTKENLNMVDVGDIHLKCNAREYQLDYLSMSRELSEDGKTITVCVDMGTFEEAKECFEDCKWDLKIEDLTNSSLVTTVFAGSDNKDITDIKFVEGSIKVNKEFMGVSTIKINSLD